MKKVVRLTESDLTRIIKRVIQEQGYVSDETINRPYFIDEKSIYTPPSGYGGGNGYQTVRGTNVWLNNQGEKNWPIGDSQKAKNSVSKLIKAMGGIDISGVGANLAQEVANEWKGFDLVTQNEFLKQWYRQTKGKEDFSMSKGNVMPWGTPWDTLVDDNEESIANDMIKISIAKVKQYCKSYVDQKNRGQDSNNPVCDTFVTNDLRAPGWN